MPAYEHRFADPLPDAVVLDADFVINVLHEGEDFHRDCLRFVDRLIQEDTIIVYSQLLRVEFLNGWRSAVNQDGIPNAWTRQRTLWEDEVSEREFIFQRGDRLLTDLLRSFRRYEIKLTSAIQKRALSYIASHNLRPLDAYLVASAHHVGLNDLVSLDAGFRRVEGLHLWNDNIPQRRTNVRNQSSD